MIRKKYFISLFLVSFVFLNQTTMSQSLKEQKMNKGQNVQNKKQKANQNFDDVFEEEDNQNHTLRFFDALTGEPIKGADVNIQKIGTFKTDGEGKVRFPIQPDGIINVEFSKEGYISTDLSPEIIVGTIFNNRFSISPQMTINQFRVVVDWGAQPEDLDAHFVKKNNYHISFRNTRELSDGTGQLDRDAMHGYGPETITVESLDNDAEYSYYIHDYTNRNNTSSKNLAQSGARVLVYGNNQLLYTFIISSNISGDTWNVFKVINGVVTPFQ